MKKKSMIFVSLVIILFTSLFPVSARDAELTEEEWNRLSAQQEKNERDHIPMGEIAKMSEAELKELHLVPLAPEELAELKMDNVSSLPYATSNAYGASVNMTNFQQSNTYYCGPACVLVHWK